MKFPYLLLVISLTSSLAYTAEDPEQSYLQAQRLIQVRRYRIEKRNQERAKRYADRKQHYWKHFRSYYRIAR